jgi:hypothetical protein
MPAAIQPIDLLDAKRLLPTELRTAELSRLQSWTRERAFYMAGVTRAEILQEMRDITRQAATGEAGEYELRQRWEAYLDGIGYVPEAGQEGTIKDLRSLRRFNVALRTNVALIHEWASKENALRPGPLRAQPAWELIRLNQPKVPRDWPERWAEVGGEFWGATARMIAPKLSSVWAELGSVEKFDDALGVDYPPFAWGSGMGRVGVGARELMELGIMTQEEIRDQVGRGAGRPVHSPNESLVTIPRITEPALREQLATELRGLAKWDKDKLVMTDPNGTRPGTAEEVAEWITEPLPNGLPNMQAKALAKWAEDHEPFSKVARNKKTIPWDRDIVEDLMRTVQRVHPYQGGAVWRGMAWRSEKSFQDFVVSLQKTKSYAPRDTKLLDSFSVGESGARKYASQGPYRAVLEVQSPKTAREIAPQVRALVERGFLKSPDSSIPLPTDGEAVFIRGVKFRVLRVDKVSDREVKIYLEEVDQ